MISEHILDPYFRFCFYIVHVSCLNIIHAKNNDNDKNVVCENCDAINILSVV